MYDKPTNTACLTCIKCTYFSVHAEAERANSYRHITNWCVLADSLSEESVKAICSAAWNGNMYVDLKPMIVPKFTTSLQPS